eukprot:13116107-Alexandrium_andersonii.AAC.1
MSSLMRELPHPAALPYSALEGTRALPIAAVLPTASAWGRSSIAAAAPDSSGDTPHGRAVIRLTF